MDEWPRYVSEVYRILKPGGYAQMGELACASPISDEGLLPYEAPMAEVAYPFLPAIQTFPIYLFLFPHYCFFEGSATVFDTSFVVF